MHYLANVNNLDAFYAICATISIYSFYRIVDVVVIRPYNNNKLKPFNNMTELPQTNRVLIFQHHTLDISIMDSNDQIQAYKAIHLALIDYEEHLEDEAKPLDQKIKEQGQSFLKRGLNKLGNKLNSYSSKL